MKRLVRKFLSLVLSFSTCVIGLIAIAGEVKQPTFDAAGRFYLYSKDVSSGAMPFVPYGVMPAEAAQMVKLDPECKVKPNPEEGEKPGDATCIKVSIAWAKPFWIAVGFFSGSDSPPWWGENDLGNHYDFSTLKKKRLVWFMRGETGKERVQVKFGVLGDKKYGDSMKFPAATGWLKMTTEWQRFELSLDKYKPSDLARVANAFTFVSNKVEQDGTGDTVFYLDTIFLE